MNLFKALIFAILMGNISLIQAEPVGTAITYQGELRQLGQPANGTYDFEIGLYSAASGGLPLDLLTLDDVAVDRGIFSIQLDFTAVPFDGEQAWLAISVRPGASSGGYTGLLPRQKLTAVPYALNALSVTAGAIDSVAIAANAVGTSKIVTNEVQRRVSGTCAAGTFLSGIAEDGGVICSAAPAGVNGTCAAGTFLSGIAEDGGVICSAAPAGVNGTCAAGTFLSGIAEDGEVICSIVPLGLVRTLDSASSGYLGLYSSIAIRDSGLPVVSYYDESSLALKLFDCSNVACSAGTVHTLDDSAAWMGQYTSIAIRDSGFPVVSYYDGSNLALKLYDCSNTACSAGTARTLDTAGNVGEHTSIAIRDSGFPVVSYYERNNGNLKLYDCSNAACSAGTARTLDTAGNVGEHSSIAIRDSGFPVVSYYDSSNNDLKLFDCSNAACSAGNVRTLDSTGYVGQYTSIAIRGSGFPMVSYYDSTNDRLKVYNCDNTACSAGFAIRLDSAGGNAGMYTSIAIRDSGLPVVSYRESVYGALKLFDCTNATCTNGTARTLDSSARTLESLGLMDTGGHISIAIRDSGLPVVSYFDASNGSLKLYSCGDDRCEN